MRKELRPASVQPRDLRDSPPVARYKKRKAAGTSVYLRRPIIERLEQLRRQLMLEPATAELHSHWSLGDVVLWLLDDMGWTSVTPSAPESPSP